MILRESQPLLQEESVKRDTETTRIDDRTSSISTVETSTTSGNEKDGRIGMESVEETPPLANGTSSSSQPLKEEEAEVTTVKQNEIAIPPPAVCTTGGRSDFCDLRGDIRVDPNSWTVYYVATSENDTIHLSPENGNTSSFSVRPYARNDDPYAMATVREWSLKMVPPSDPDLPFCYEIHDDAGVIFSLAGYAGHRFHLFTDVLVPLFATARPFEGEVELLATDYQSWLVPLLKPITGALSRYEVIDIDKERQGEKTHCFSTLTLGLKGRHLKELSINPLQSPYRIKDFIHLLRTVYSLNKTTTTTTTAATKPQPPGDNNKSSAAAVPRLLIISRKTVRTFTNLRDIARMATGLGFRVTVAEPSAMQDLPASARVVHSCDVVLGVHGSDLTNVVFLPDGAVFIQVVPVALEWCARTFYEEPSTDMDVRYLEYRIGREESSLAGEYAEDDAVFTDPASFERKGWGVFKSIYLDNQNVTIDTQRFRPTLLKALAMFSQPNRTFNW
ncbi:unnamed protein product [Linum trigynum]